MKLYLFYLFIFWSVFINAQKSNSFFKLSSIKKLSSVEKKLNIPTSKVYELDVKSLSNYLKDIPKYNFQDKTSPVVLTLPNSESKTEKYYVFENSTMHPTLQAKYPNIR